MREICINNQNKIDFDNIDNRDCKNLTGLLLDQFEDTQSGTPNAVLSLAPLKYQIMIRNNPTEVLGVREGVLLIFININEQVSSN
jgi:hypothetical protein